jgi:osmotically inducible protein OsmC
MPVSKGHAEWSGDIPTGSGQFTAGDSITGGVTYKSRFEGGPGSSPEQLIAAAHAACFSMALAGRLATAGFPATRIATDAAVTLRPVGGVPTITKIELTTTGLVLGLEQPAFLAYADEAKATCPVSRALAGGPEISLTASFEA